MMPLLQPQVDHPRSCRCQSASCPSVELQLLQWLQGWIGRVSRQKSCFAAAAETWMLSAARQLLPRLLEVP